MPKFGDLNIQTLLHTLVVITASFLSPSLQAQTTFQNCEPYEQEQILSDISFSQTLVEAQMIKIHTRFLKDKPPSLNPYSLTNRWTRALLVLSCVRNVMPKLDYKCNMDIEAAAQTRPVFGRTVKLNKDHSSKTRRRDRASVLIHEASHKCGTTDANYVGRTLVGDQIECILPQDESIIPWDMIASTYDFWARHEFCDPDQAGYQPSCNCNLD